MKRNPKHSEQIKRLCLARRLIAEIPPSDMKVGGIKGIKTCDNQGVEMVVIVGVGRYAAANLIADADCRALYMENIASCRYCGCTDNTACEGGCSWISPNVCSNPSCVEQYELDKFIASKRLLKERKS